MITMETLHTDDVSKLQRETIHLILMISFTDLTTYIHRFSLPITHSKLVRIFGL